MAFNDDSQTSKFEEISKDLIQVHQDINYRGAVSTGISIAAGVGIMAVLGRFAVVYGPKTNMLGYLWMLLFVAPLVLTYAERSEAISGPGGIYGLVRDRHGIVVSFLVGWLELGGYAAVVAILARISVIYSLTLYTTFGGGAFEGSNLSLKWMTIGIVLLFLIFKVSGWRGSRRLNTLLVYSGLLLLTGTALYSLFSYREELSGISMALRTVRPLRLSAMLMSSFWGVLMIYGFRRRIIRRRKLVLLQIHWSVSLIVIGLGALLAIATLPVVSLGSGITGVLSVNNFSGIIFIGSEIITALIALLSLVMALMGLSRSLQGSIEIISVMTDDVFFPKSFNFRLHRAIFPPLLIVAILVIIMVTFLDTMMIVGMAAAFLLWITIFVHAPDVIRPRPNLPAERPLRLPYHPLFPSLTVVAATVAIFNLGWDNLKWSLVWMGVGVAVLGLYSYRRALRARGKRQTYGDEDDMAPDSAPQQQAMVEGKPVQQTPIVLAFVRDLDNLPRIISMGRRVAARTHATLNLMQIVEVSDQRPLYVQRNHGRKLWEHLAELVGQWKSEAGVTDEVVIKPMVRMTTNLIEGVINAAQEEHALFLLLPPDFITDDRARNIEQYDKILQLAPGNILFLNQFPSADEVTHATVLVGDGGHARSSLVIADALTAADGVIEVIHYLPHDVSEDEEAGALKKVQMLVHDSDIDDDRADIRILHMSTLEEAVHELVSDTDLLLLGAARNFMTRRATFGGINARIFQSSVVPTLMVRAHEKIRFAWFSRLWETITAPLPKLTLDEREEVVAEVTAGATPSVDFFVLIILSSGIAMYGLLQNSGAVIIGAMLVAPLMSPIVSMAMSIVRGDIKHLGQGAQATAQGVLMAIFVGALLTFLSPIRQPTNEILSRVSPNLLDLGVAFLSGAAGGYAMSRKSIAAALPGVAIAAALVPPLAVVGFGFATADLSIAFGALLLFTTNLIAIVLAAALVFLAMDFLSPEKQSWGEVVRGLKITLAFLAIIIIILGFVTFRAVKEQHQLAAIHKVMTKSLYSQSFTPLDVQITGHLNNYQITATLLSYDKPLSSEDLDQLGKELEAAVGAPVTFDLTVIDAKQARFDIQSEVTITQIEEAVKEALTDLPVDIVSVQAQEIREGYEVDLVVVAFQRNALSQKMVDDMEAELSQQFDAPFKIVAYELPADKIEAGGTPTPTPDVTITPTLTPAP